MADHTPLYRYSLDEARRNHELDLWRASHKANVACREKIEQTVARNFDGMRLSASTAKELFGECGIDRVNWVLANTVQNAEWDGRYSHDNREWANGFRIPHGGEFDFSHEFSVNSHPAVLDGLITQARREYAKLNLFGFQHCEENSRDLDFENKVVVLAPECLKDKYKSPDFQLLYAFGGFGCSPTARGRRVFAEFLKDGEKTSYDRADFLGVIKNEYLPEWAREKLMVLHPPATSQEQDGGMTMKP